MAEQGPIHSGDSAVAVSGLTQSFGGPDIIADIDLTFAPGSIVALLGRSGSGKSTLLRLLAGLDQPSRGSLHVPAQRAVVFQEPRLVPWKRVWQNMTLGVRGDGVRERALAALEEVHLSHRLTAWPLTLSGGEAQRVALARALVRQPKLLLMDEPFAALDALTRLNMHELVLALWRAHAPTVLIVTHDVDEALVLADRVLVLAEGRIALDLAVDLARPRRASLPAFEHLRTRLLGQLGVDLEGSAQAASRDARAGVAPRAAPRGEDRDADKSVLLPFEGATHA